MSEKHETMLSRIRYWTHFMFDDIPLNVGINVGSNKGRGPAVLRSGRNAPYIDHPQTHTVLTVAGSSSVSGCAGGCWQAATAQISLQIAQISRSRAQSNAIQYINTGTAEWICFTEITVIPKSAYIFMRSHSASLSDRLEIDFACLPSFPPKDPTLIHRGRQRSLWFDNEYYDCNFF